MEIKKEEERKYELENFIERLKCDLKKVEGRFNISLIN